jgi:hypothetical protein
MWSTANARAAPHAGAQVVARGETAAGTSYTIRAKKGDGRFCRASITVTEIAPDGHFESAQCFSGFVGGEISMTCPGNRVAIEAIAPAITRRMRVRLADGSTLSSRVAKVPARDGGPFAVYFQAFRASTASPVTLTELDARGHIVGRMHNLGRHSSCKGGSGSGATSEEQISTSPHS